MVLGLIGKEVSIAQVLPELLSQGWCREQGGQELARACMCVCEQVCVLESACACVSVSRCASGPHGIFIHCVTFRLYAFRTEWALEGWAANLCLCLCGDSLYLLKCVHV